MNKHERLANLIAQFQKIEPRLVNAEYEVKGTSLRILAETAGPGYQRVKAWVDEKVRLLVIKNRTDMVSQTHEEMMREQAAKCLELYKSRAAKYGDSWKQLRLGSYIDLMMMKLDRCQKQQLDNKAIEVEIEDCVNYGLMILTKIRNNL